MNKIVTIIAFTIIMAQPIASGADTWTDAVGTVTTNGKVGIGVADPSAQLTVVDQSGLASRGIVSREYWSGPNGAILSLEKARGNQSAPSPVTSGDYLGAVLYKGLTNGGWLHTASVGARVNGIITDTSMPTELFFATSDTNFNNAFLDGTVRMMISSSGNVGIGTTSPETQLQVVKDTTSGGSIVFLDGYEGDGLSNGPNIAIRQSRGSVTSPAATKQNDIVGQVNFRGRGPTGFAAIRRAGVLGYATEDYTDTAQGTMLTLSTTANGTTTPRDRVFIDGDGNVGIGTDSPTTQKLEVNGGVRLVPQPGLSSCNENSRGTFWVEKDDINGDRVQVCVKAKNASGAIEWRTITLNSSGN